MTRRLAATAISLAMVATVADVYIGGTLTYNRPRWDDLRFPASVLGIPPGVAPFTTPDWEVFPVGTSNPTFSRCFDPTSDEGLLIPGIQMPHERALDTDYRPHIHWSPTTTNTGVVAWRVVCSSLTNADGTFSGTQVATLTDSGDGTISKHQIIGNEYFTVSGETVSAMMDCSVYRDADGSDGIADTYTGDACLHEVDFHVRTDTPGGSEAETSK